MYTTLVWSEARNLHFLTDSSAETVHNGCVAVIVGRSPFFYLVGLLWSPALCATSLLSVPEPCGRGTLSDWISLGSTGCTVGTSMFSSFRYSGFGTGGAILPAPDRIDVIPVPRADNAAAGFVLLADWSVAGSQGLSMTLGYYANPVPYSETFSGFGSAFNAAGQKGAWFQVYHSFCIAGRFDETGCSDQLDGVGGGTGWGGPWGGIGGLATFGGRLGQTVRSVDIQSHYTLTAPASSELRVVALLENLGSQSPFPWDLLGQFSPPEPAPIPEPCSALLMLSALATIAWRSRNSRPRRAAALRSFDSLRDLQTPTS